MHTTVLKISSRVAVLVMIRFMIANPLPRFGHRNGWKESAADDFEYLILTHKKPNSAKAILDVDPSEIKRSYTYENKVGTNQIIPKIKPGKIDKREKRKRKGKTLKERRKKRVGKEKTVDTFVKVLVTSNEVTTPNCNCGISKELKNDGNRIVGGRLTKVEDYPWQISITDQNMTHICGGTILTRRHVLSAAHCFQSLDASVSAINVVLWRNSEGWKIHEVKQIRRHKRFSSETKLNDIAILLLESPLVFDSEIYPVCLPSAGEDYSDNEKLLGRTGKVLGFGETRRKLVDTWRSRRSKRDVTNDLSLRQTSLRIMSNEECQEKFSKGGIEDVDQLKSETIFCAFKNGTDACSGDSGGPLVLSEQGRYFQVGIVSYGLGCADGRYPGVYTNIDKFRAWIKHNTKGEDLWTSDCQNINS